MPFPRPTLRQIVTRVAADIQSRLPGTDALLRVTLLGILGRALAGAIHELYGYAEWIYRQIFPDTCGETMLLRWAAIWGVERQAAKIAKGTVTFTGAPGTSIRRRDVRLRSGAGVEYLGNQGRTAIGDGGTLEFRVRAAEAGAAGNADTGVTLTLVSPIAGVESAAPVSTAIAGGADIEGVEALRQRVLERIRNPPRGGNEEDYEAWARESHQDVTRAWARPRASGLGTVTVYAMTDDVTEDGIPAAAVILSMRDYIARRRPVGAEVTSAAPVAEAIDITITSVTPDTADVRAAIAAELADTILRDSEPGGTILLSHLREAISTAAGETDHDITVPAGDVTVQANQIPVLGDITWPGG